MTANIPQHVTPRRNRRTSFIAQFSPYGSWQATRRVAPARTRQARAGLPLQALLQRGSATQSTITVTFAVIVSVALGFLSFLYLQQVFGTANQGADVAELKTRLIEISEQQRELELEGAKLRSIDTVEERVEQLNLVESTNHAFLAPDVNRVAFDG